MLSNAYRQKAARALFGSTRSEVMPAVLWLGWLDSTGEVTTERVRVPNTDAVFTPSGDGVANLAPIDAGVATGAWTLTAAGLWDAATGGVLVITMPLPTPVTVSVNDLLAVPAGGLKLGAV